MDQARIAFGRGLELEVNTVEGSNGFIDRLESTLSKYRPGQCPVWIRYHGETASTRLCLGDEWKVQPSEQLLQRLQGILSPEQVRLVYSRDATANTELPAA
jgi:DNA polymerase-3 subunit alpha